MSGDSNRSGESPRIWNYLPSFLDQPMHIFDKVFQRVLDVGQNIGNTSNDNGVPANDSNEIVSEEVFRTVPHSSPEADFPISVTMDLDPTISGRVENVIYDQCQNVSRKGRPLGNAFRIGHPSRNISKIERPSRNMDKRGRPFGNAAKIGHPSRNISKIKRPRRNVAKRGRGWRSPRYEDMPYRTSFEGGEMYHRFPSSHELVVATGLTSEDDERRFTINWHNYEDWTSSSEIYDHDFTEARPIQCLN